MAPNLYVHFPFCRRKCSYCTLFSRPGSTAAERAAYVASLVPEARGTYRTAYFGGGTPGLCDLRPLLEVIEAEEFTVELHPLDVTKDLLATLKAGGVNRISMGLQSVDDAILAHMGRGYTFAEAERAFGLIREHFENAGIDLIVGYPGETAALLPRHARLAKWGLAHCSAYTLINDRHLAHAIDDDTTMNRLAILAAFLHDLGLERYEISNYARPGFECRHNLAVWRGEDYKGVGKGAYGRLGRLRTPSGEVLSPLEDLKERTLFRLRTREGLETSSFPEWRPALDRFVAEGLLTSRDSVYFLTPRGREVCDAIMAEIV